MTGLLLALIALPGCIWSSHLHELQVAVDSPGALAVAVQGPGGPVDVLAPGDSEATASVAIGGHDVQFTRSPAGVRIACDTCDAPMILLRGDGTFIPVHRRAVDLDGEQVRVTRPYYLRNNSDWHSDYWGSWYEVDESYVLVHATADRDRVVRITARQHPSRIVGAVMWAGVFGLGIPAMDQLRRERYAVGAAMLAPTLVLSWWGVGQLFGPRRDIVVYERP